MRPSNVTNGDGPGAGTLWEHAAVPFDVECILPSQLGARREITGNQRLVAAVLGAMLDDATCMARGRGSVYRHEALAWIGQDDRGDPLGRFSFLEACEYLGMDPAAVRRQIAAGAVKYGTVRALRYIPHRQRSLRVKAS